MLKENKAVRALVVAALVFQSAACGTILHPERRGQRGGRIDAGIAVLDGLGLLLFIIPGVIAFAVDFSNGTIYLPPGRKASLDPRDLRTIRFDRQGDAKAEVEEILRRRTGLAIRLDQENAKIIELGSVDELPARLAAATGSENVL